MRVVSLARAWRIVSHLALIRAVRHLCLVLSTYASVSLFDAVSFLTQVVCCCFLVLCRVCINTKPRLPIGLVFHINADALALRISQRA